MPRKTILIVTVSQLINYGLPVITFALLVKALDIKHYGIWIEASTIVGLLTTFGTHGLGNALGAMVVNKNDDIDKIYSSALYLFLIITVTLILLLCLSAPWIEKFTIRDPIGTLVIRIASFSIFINAFNWLAGQVYRLRQEAMLGAIFDITNSVARLGAVIFAFFQRDLIAFALVLVISQMVLAIIQTIFAYRSIRLTKPSWNISRELVKYGLNLSVVSQASWLVMYGDRLLLSILALTTAVAVYSASYQLTFILVALGWPYIYALLPLLGEKWKAQDIEGMQNLVLKSTRMILIMLTPAVIGLALTGNALLHILASDEFAQGGLLVGMIALGVALDTIGNALQYIFYAQGRPQVLRNIYLQAAALNILANLVMIPLFSYNGAGLTTMLTFIYIFYRLWRKTEMPFTALFDMSVFWRCLLISVVMGLWVAFTVTPTIVGLGVAIIGGALIYGAGLLLLRVLTVDDVLSVPRAVMRRFAPQS